MQHVEGPGGHVGDDQLATAGAGPADGGSADEGPAEVGPVVMDNVLVRVERCHVDVDGTTISLSPRERDVLAVLVRRPGSVVNKQQLLRHVWNGSADGHAVEVTVGRLRRRLEGVLQIETVPRRGYRLVGPTD